MNKVAVDASAIKPENGLAGLKHIRHDILSGVVVSLVSLPLSSGIAIASGVPPIYGLISAIIAGLVFPLVGGAYVTIAGPAAGLAPAILAVMAGLGGIGDAEHVGAGYHFLLVVIFMVGCVQIVMALLKLARFAGVIPMSVVEGMLASIGLLIIVKQIPMFFGYGQPVHAHEFLEFVRDTPHYVASLNPAVFGVALFTISLLFLMGSLKHWKVFKVIPPQLLAVTAGLIAGQVVGLDPKFLIKLPANPFHGIHTPAFTELMGRRDLWYVAIMGVVTLTLIDGVESLATVMAIDRIDPFRRKSRPNRVLLAMGVCNIASSLVGGLTIIPGGVKSKANIASGGRTLWANFTNAICLIVYLLVAAPLIGLIPKGVLAAVLIYTGWKMCEPLVWKHMAHIGMEQLAIFTFTVMVTLATDLLWGIAAGVVAKFVLNLVLYRQAIAATGDLVARPSLAQSALTLFRDPISSRELIDGCLHVYLDKPLVCFNSVELSRELGRLPAEAKALTIHLDAKSVGLIDHTSCENLMDVIREYSDSEVPVEIVGMEDMKPLSHYHACTHVSMPTLAAQAV